MDCLRWCVCACFQVDNSSEYDTCLVFLYRFLSTFWLHLYDFSITYSHSIYLYNFDSISFLPSVFFVQLFFHFRSCPSLSSLLLIFRPSNSHTHFLICFRSNRVYVELIIYTSPSLIPFASLRFSLYISRVGGSTLYIQLITVLWFVFFFSFARKIHQRIEVEPATKCSGFVAV